MAAPTSTRGLGDVGGRGRSTPCTKLTSGIGRLGNMSAYIPTYADIPDGSADEDSLLTAKRGADVASCVAGRHLSKHRHPRWASMMTSAGHQVLGEVDARDAAGGQLPVDGLEVPQSLDSPATLVLRAVSTDSSPRQNAPPAPASKEDGLRPRLGRRARRRPVSAMVSLWGRNRVRMRTR